MCALNPELVIITGSASDEDEASASVESFDLRTKQQKKMPQMLFGRFFHSSCAMNGRQLYCFGGYEALSKFYLPRLDCIDFTK